MAVEKQMTPAELSEKVLAEQEEKIQVEIENPDSVSVETEDGGVIIDFEGKINGEGFEGNESKDFKLTIGSKSMIPGSFVAFQ